MFQKILRLWTWCLLSAATQAAYAQSAVVTTEHVRAELMAYAPDGIGPNKVLWLGLHLKHAPHWHTYWKNPGDSGLATTMTWSLPSGVDAGAIEWPTPEKLPVGPLMNYGYGRDVLLPAKVTLPPTFNASTLQIGLRSDWLVCHEICIPESGQFALAVPADGTAEHAKLFQAAFDSIPTDATGRARSRVKSNTLMVEVSGLPATLRGKAAQFFAEDEGVIEHAGAVAAKWDEDRLRLEVPVSLQRSASPPHMAAILVFAGQKAGMRVSFDVAGGWPGTEAATAPDTSLSTSLWVTALMAFVGGLALNLMPCVFPVLSLKVVGFAAHQGNRRRAVLSGVAYTTGVLVTFLGLAALLLFLRSTGEQLGWGFQLQSPIFIVFLSALFTLIGLNLIGVFEVGTLLPQSLATLRARHPLCDDFLSGALAVAVASPCTAPLMGAAIGATLSQPAPMALAVFALLGLGMATPYLAASLSPAIARRLPRPGTWMVRFKIAMAFPMFATVIWLVWVLGQQVGIDSVAQTLGLLLVLTFAIWCFAPATVSGNGTRTMRALSVILLVGAAAWVWPGLQVRHSAGGGAAVADHQQWQEWSPAAFAQAQMSGKPVFVDFTAAWCITCQFNKRTTLANADVLKAFASRDVVLLRADWTWRDERITKELAALGRAGVPVYALYRPGVPKPVLLPEILSPRIVTDALNTLK